MKKQLIRIIFFFFIIITVVVLGFNRQELNDSFETSYQEKLVDLNEIVKLSEKRDEKSQEKLEQAVADFRGALIISQNKGRENDRKTVWILYCLSISFLMLVFLYIYKVILRPFDKLQRFTEEIAKGNFDIELQYERTNYFGKFTWAFDHMRKEITKARACEREAIDNNKTVIATLSHDIKTPIASIRAYAEMLDANLASGPEMRRKYSMVIMKKCDEVTKLTDDLFLHSLSDLDKLKINPRNENIRELIEKIISELQTNDKSVILLGKIPDKYILIDAKRFEQVVDNLINNIKKYAPESIIKIYSEADENNIFLYVQDYGNGIADEDMPFIFDKFYRGRNVGDQQGSGLGLYIVKYIMEQMEGSVTLMNTGEGLKVTLSLPLSS
jgi:signal transduction histidine kinase